MTTIARMLVGIIATLLVAHPALAAPAVVVAPVITVTGNVFDPLTRTPVAGASVEFIERHSGRLLASTLSDAAGLYTVTIETGGKPVDVYVRATKEGRVTTLVFPPDPLTADLAPCEPFAGTRECILIASLAPAAADVMAGFAGVTRDPARGEALVIASDCTSKGAPVMGATLAIAPKAEQVVYTAGPFPAPLTAATDASGRAFGFNIKPGMATIRATYPNGDTGVSQVRVEAGAITIASTLPKNANCAR